MMIKLDMRKKIPRSTTNADARYVCGSYNLLVKKNIKPTRNLKNWNLKKNLSNRDAFAKTQWRGKPPYSRRFDISHHTECGRINIKRMRSLVTGRVTYSNTPASLCLRYGTRDFLLFIYFQHEEATLSHRIIRQLT